MGALPLSKIGAKNETVSSKAFGNFKEEICLTFPKLLYFLVTSHNHNFLLDSQIMTKFWVLTQDPIRSHWDFGDMLWLPIERSIDQKWISE